MSKQKKIEYGPFDRACALLIWRLYHAVIKQNWPVAYASAVSLRLVYDGKNEGVARAVRAVAEVMEWAQESPEITDVHVHLARDWSRALNNVRTGRGVGGPRGGTPRPKPVSGTVINISEARERHAS